MAEAIKEIVGPILGEVTREAVEVANAVAEALLTGDEQREKVKLHLPDGQEVEGVAFRSSDDTAVVVSDGFIAIDNKEGKVVKFLPRKLE